MLGAAVQLGPKQDSTDATEIEVSSDSLADSNWLVAFGHGM